MKHILGNWKMHGSASDLWAWQEQFVPTEGVNIGLFLPAILLHSQPVNFFTGAQDVSIHEGQGAFTGEISATMIKDTGARMVLCGHSERRHVMGETDAIVKKKAENALRAGLEVVLCVGEPLEIRENGTFEDYVERQLLESFPFLASPAQAGASAPMDPNLRWESETIMIAYEPVWAIGTGKVASIAAIAAMHDFIKRVAPIKNIAIVYGGSVKAGNAHEILHTQGVDGVLVGGASLKADEFQKICEAAL